MNKQAEQIKTAVEETLAKTESIGGVKQLYFVGCGGSLGALYPAKTFVETEARLSKPVGTTAMNSSMPPQRISDPTR